MQQAPERSRHRPVVDAPARSIWRRAAAGGLLAALLVGLAAALVHRQDLRHREALLLREGSHVVALEREFLTRELRAVESDLRFLSQQPLLERLLAGDSDARAPLEREYAGFARSKPLYDQIRLLDERGREVVRINRRGDEVEIVAEDELQSKAGRYYFREGMALSPGEVFVSPLDLNVEREEIERPLKPVIRLLTPVTDRAGTTRNLLVLNYLGASLLGKLRELAGRSGGDVMLVNLQGEYLRAPDPSREWGWLLGHSASFRDDHPAAWERIRQVKREQFRLGDDLFTAERISLTVGSAAAGSAVVVVSRIPKSLALDPRTATLRVVLSLTALTGIALLAFYWARAVLMRREQERRLAESEARLRVLSSRLLAAQEAERKALSRVLHDELGQRVTAVTLDLKAALRHGVEGEHESMLRRAIAETEGVLSSLHEIATRVRPSVLDDLGLEEAIESYVSEFEERTGVSVETKLRLPAGALPGTLGENLYRIVQEALSNIAAHARTGAARVELVADPGGIELTIEDWGRGFDAGTSRSSGRLGLLGMRERVELLAGEFHLETQPGRGTRIHVRLPLPGSQADPRVGGG